MLKQFYYHQKICSDILSNPRVGFSTPRADKTQKMTKMTQKMTKLQSLKKLLKLV